MNRLEFLFTTILGIQKPTKTEKPQNKNMRRFNDTLVEWIDEHTGEVCSFNKITTYADGSAMNDAKCDGVIYKKLGSEYFKRNFTGAVNVKWFGAKGDGTNSIPAFLLAFVTAQNLGVNILVNDGIFTFTDNVDFSIYKDVTLIISNSAKISHGDFTINLPQRIDTGTQLNNCFIGSGLLKVKNADEIYYPVLPGGYEQTGNHSIGVNALKENIEGTNNIAWGVNALKNNKKGSSNIAIGNNSLKTVDGGILPAEGTFTGEGWNNIGIGDHTLESCTTGYENMAIGAMALQKNTTGRWNLAVGHDSQILQETGECNISFGAYSLVVNLGNNNIAIGWACLEGQLSGSNTAIGHVCMNGNRTGTLNTAIGGQALFKSETGNNNTAIGQEAATNIVNGNRNTAIGAYALASADTNNSDNTAVGSNALLLAKGTGLTAVGSEALQDSTTGEDNTAVGFGAGGNVTSGSNNTIVGKQALAKATTAINNTAIGRNSLFENLTGNENTAIGSGALNAIVTEENSTGVGFNSQVTGSNQVQLGDSRTTTYAYGAVQSRSDARDKTEIRPTVLGLEFVNSLKPVDFKYAYREANGETGSRFHHGLIAQDIQELISLTGVDFGGFQDHSVNGGKDVLSVGYTELISVLVKAVQELSLKVSALEQNH